LVVRNIVSKLANIVRVKEKWSKRCISLKKNMMSVFSDNECAFHSGVHKFFEDEGITQVITFTRTNVAELFIRTMKSMMHERVRFNRGSWTAMLSRTHSTVYIILHHFLNTLLCCSKKYFQHSVALALCGIAAGGDKPHWHGCAQESVGDSATLLLCGTAAGGCKQSL